jgi:hypothetical protein
MSVPDAQRQYAQRQYRLRLRGGCSMLQTRKASAGGADTTRHRHSLSLAALEKRVY